MTGKNNAKNVLLLFGLLTEFAFALLAGGVGGYLLDNWFGTKPILTIILLLGALFTSVKIFMMILKKAKDAMENND